MEFYGIKSIFRVGNTTTSLSATPNDAASINRVYVSPADNYIVMRVRDGESSQYKIIITKQLHPTYDMIDTSNNSVCSGLRLQSYLVDGYPLYGHLSGGSVGHLRYVNEHSATAFMVSRPIGHVPTSDDAYWVYKGGSWNDILKSSVPVIYSSDFTFFARGKAEGDLFLRQRWPRWEYQGGYNWGAVDGYRIAVPPAGVYLPVDASYPMDSKYVKIGKYDKDTKTWSHDYAFARDMYVGGNAIRWM